MPSMTVSACYAEQSRLENQMKHWGLPKPDNLTNAVA